MKLGSVNVLLIAFLSQSHAQRNKIKRDAMERQLDQIHLDIDSGMEKYFEAKENEHFKVMENAQMKVGEAIVRLRDLGQDEEAEALAEEIGRVFNEEEFVERVVNEDEDEDSEVGVDEIEDTHEWIEVPQGGVDEYEDSQLDVDESDNRQVDELDVDEIHYAIQENIDTYQHAKEDGEPEAMEDAKTSVEYGLEALKSLGHTEEAYQYEEDLKEIFE